MSKIILNGIDYSNGITYQELQPVIYSTEEREIGCFVDGKPLYQRTYSGLSVTSSTSFHTMGITTSGIETLVNSEECGSASDGRLISFNVDAYIATNGTLYSAEFSNGWTIKSITLQYTKTTDTAGSGIWNGQGGIAHHYSTNETVIGTWIDGEPLYQKTVVLNNLSVTNNQWAKTNESATNIKMIADGFLIDNQSPSQTFQCDIGVDGGKIAVLTWFVGNSTRTMSYLTFKYTKTTD